MIFDAKQGCAMAQVVSCQPVTLSLCLFQGQSIWDLWWTKWQWNRFFST